MSEENLITNEIENDSIIDAQTAENLTEEETHFEENKDADPMLQLLVNMAEMGVKLPITLHIGGNTITGQMISKNDYQEYFLSVMRETFSTSDPETQDFLEKAYFEPIEDGVRNSKNKASSRPFNSLRLLYLRNARFLTGNTQFIPTQGEGVHWRGRINSVDGFIIGLLSPETPKKIS